MNWQDAENPRAGGAEVHLHETFGRMAARGHEVTLLVSGFRGGALRAELDGMEIHRTGGRYTFSAHAPVYYRERLAPRRFDVVVEDLNKVPLFSPLWCGRPVVPLFHHLFGRTAFSEANPALAAATWLLERPIPRVFKGLPAIAVSESTKADLRARGLKAPISVVHNGVDAKRYTPAPEAVRTSRPTVLYLGRLARYKGVDVLLRAAAMLDRSDTPVNVIVAGDGVARRELERLGGELGLEERVRFLGFVSEDRKLELYRSAWLHVLPSPKEGWGITVVEAAACATPSVASDSPGLRESVRDGETGVLVPHGDERELAAAIRRLVENRSEREAMGRRARSFAESLSWERATEKMEEILVGAAGREPEANGHV